MVGREHSLTIPGVLSSRLGYIGLTLLLFGAALLFRFELPLQPFIDSDVGGYLEPALRQLTHGHFLQVEGRNFVYPGFIYLVLRVFPDFRAAAITQHLLGLAAGGLLLACWNCARTLIKSAIVPAGLYRLFGLPVAALFLFNTSVVRLEHLIRPEAIFPFFAALNMLFNIQFIRYRYIELSYRASLLYGSANLFNACLLFFLKPSFYLGVGFSTLPIWFSLVDRKEPFQRKLAMIGVPALCISLLLLLPEKSIKAGDELSKTFLPTTLFVMHADIIRDQISRDLRDDVKTPYEKQFLEQTEALLAQEIELSKGTGRYRSLGFDPDYLMYEDSFDQKFQALLGSEQGAEDRIKFYYYYFFRAWTNQPERMLMKVLRQLSILYNNIGKASPYKHEIELVVGRNYLNNCVVLDAKRSLSEIPYAPLADFSSKSRELARVEPKLLQPAAVSWVNGALSRTFSISIILMSVLLVMVLRNPRLRESYGFFALTIALFFSYSFANSLGIAIVHSLEITRYLTNQLIFCLLPQCMTLFLIAEIWMCLSLHRSQISKDL
jgi:hypothetical protein